MKKWVLLLLILLLPSYTFAAYKIYLKNGAEIPGVKTYSERGEDIYLYFSSGQMVVSKKDVLRIEGSETTEPQTETGEPESSQESKTSPEVRTPQERPSDTDSPSSSADTANKAARLAELRTELDSIASELRDVQEQESGLVKEINEKTGRRFSYNLIQMKQLEKEVEPLKTELVNVQQRKSELQQRKATVESEMRELR
jgi:hypothetical protein